MVDPKSIEVSIDEELFLLVRETEVHEVTFQGDEKECWKFKTALEFGMAKLYSIYKEEKTVDGIKLHIGKRKKAHCFDTRVAGKGITTRDN